MVLLISSPMASIAWFCFASWSESLPESAIKFRRVVTVLSASSESLSMIRDNFFEVVAPEGLSFPLGFGLSSSESLSIGREILLRGGVTFFSSAVSETAELGGSSNFLGSSPDFGS
uniref:(northern house mosquito) hypothetical protein n=1 Tax=Culex pipiens TaxID=7175 RepID=A0A8D8FQ13_CULPI